jgi:RHS repeat-associated protein
VHFIYAGGAHGGNAFAMLVKKQSRSTPEAAPTSAMRYNLFDHLGSVTATTDETGQVLGASAGANTTVFGYDPWGKRRGPDGRPATGPLNPQVGRREFTGHESIPEVGLINMNGRVYDPDLGRFLSPDPTVQFVANLQSYNRYSYVLNNPLSFTDPTGFLRIHQDPEWKRWAMVGAGVAAMYVSAVGCAYGGYEGCIVAAGIAGAIVGASSVALSGGSWEQTVLAADIGFVEGAGMAVVGMGVSKGVGWLGGSGPVAGAVSGAVVSILGTEFSGAKLEWKNILIAAAQGALFSLGRPADSSEEALSQAGAARQQGGGPYDAPNCNGRCKAAIDKAFGGNPLAKNLTGWDYIEETGEIGTGKYDGLPKAEFQDWVVRKVQPILDSYGVDYDVASTEIYVGTPNGRSSSPDYGVINLATPGDDPGGSFARTGRTIMHELGHQAQMSTVGGYAPFMATWSSEKAQYRDPGMYNHPGSLEFQADQFANQYLPVLFR